MVPRKVTWSQSGWVVAWGHVWVHGPAIARVCANGQCTCYHPRPYRHLKSRAMLLSQGHTAAGAVVTSRLSHCLRTMSESIVLLWLGSVLKSGSCITTKGHIKIFTKDNFFVPLILWNVFFFHFHLIDLCPDLNYFQLPIWGLTWSCFSKALKCTIKLFMLKFPDLIM